MAPRWLATEWFSLEHLTSSTFSFTRLLASLSVLLLSAGIKLLPSFLWTSHSSGCGSLLSFLPVYCSLLDMRNTPGSSPGGEMLNTLLESIYVLSMTFPMMAERTYGCLVCRVICILPDFDTSIFSELNDMVLSEDGVERPHRTLVNAENRRWKFSTPSNQLFLFHSNAWSSGSAALIRSIRTGFNDNMAQCGCLFRPISNFC